MEADRHLEPLHVLRVAMPAPEAAEFDVELERQEIALTSWHAEGRVRFEAYCQTEAEASALGERLEALLQEAPGPGRYTLDRDRLASEDWQESWKRFFKTERVSERVVIKPSWEAFCPGEGDCVVEIDPGMSFGTGQHPTTRSCIALLDALSEQFPGASLLDVGCGSGVLSIAAAKLGYRDVTAFDIDAGAVRVAEENIALNGLASQLRVFCSDLAGAGLERSFEVVVSNIYADVLEAHAQTLSSFVAEGAPGRLVLSGILSTHYPPVRTAYGSLNWQEIDRRIEGDWTTALFARVE